MVQQTRPFPYRALRELAGALSAAWDLDTTLEEIAKKTTEVMNVDSCSIYLLDTGRETLRLRTSTGLFRDSVGRVTLSVGEGMTGQAVLLNQPIFAAEAADDPSFKFLEGTRETEFSSLLAVPLLSNNQTIGALNVQTKEPKHYTEEETDILSLIGDLVAGALARARHHDRQEAQLNELQALARVSEAVTSPQYLTEILDLVTEMAAKSMNALICSLHLLDATGEVLELRAAENSTHAYSERPPHPADSGVLGLVVQRQESIYVPNVQTDPRYTERDLAISEGLVSMLSEPLTVRDRVIGVLSCYTAVERQFSQEQRTLFRSLANQTALAIENAQLVTNAAVVREMHHRIKNNLQMVAMLMQMQLSDANEVTAQEVLELNINRIRSISAVHDVLSEKSFRQVNVKEVLERVMSLTSGWASSSSAPSISINITGVTILLPSKEATSLVLVVNELVQNALEHAFVGQTYGIITISLGRTPDELIVVVEDDGVGMPASSTLGLGLEIAQTLIVEDLGGSLDFGRKNAGTEVSIRLPR